MMIGFGAVGRQPRVWSGGRQRYCLMAIAHTKVIATTSNLLLEAGWSDVRRMIWVNVCSVPCEPMHLLDVATKVYDESKG
jgi:hypothetical protein